MAGHVHERQLLIYCQFATHLESIHAYAAMFIVQHAHSQAEIYIAQSPTTAHICTQCTMYMKNDVVLVS